MPAIKRIELPQNLTQLAYDSIKTYILCEDLDEDTRLTEDSLSEQLGISKSPVREALNSLQTEGLIRIEPRRGAYLRRFSIQEVKDLYELREALEVYAVGAWAIASEEGSNIRRARIFFVMEYSTRLDAAAAGHPRSGCIGLENELAEDHQNAAGDNRYPIRAINGGGACESFALRILVVQRKRCELREVL